MMLELGITDHHFLNSRLLHISERAIVDGDLAEIFINSATVSDKYSLSTTYTRFHISNSQLPDFF